MKRWQAITLGVLAGVVLAGALLMTVIGVRPEEGAEAAVDGPLPVQLRQPIVPAAPERVRTQAVTVYQRAMSGELLLAPVTAQIIWFSSPVERARQIAQLAIEGIPAAKGVVRPSTATLRVRELYIDAQGTAWVDLEAEGVARLQGSDEEQSVVAALSRSLVLGIDEIHRVGVLVGGEPRRTLAGHLDLSRVFSGREWPATDDKGHLL